MIKRIEVKGLNGRFDFSFDFHPDLNLLTGKNGVGKTTLLKLIYYIISGNLEKLIPEMSFSSVRLLTSDYELTIDINAKVAEIAEVSRWFACEVDKHLKGQASRTDPILARLIPIPHFRCNDTYLAEIDYYEVDARIRDHILKNYVLALRGKLLFEIIVRFTHAPDRKRRKYSYDALIEIATVYGLGGNLSTRILNGDSFQAWNSNAFVIARELDPFHFNTQ